MSDSSTAYTRYRHDLQAFPDKWIVDGGATSHFSGHKSDLVSLESIPPKLVKGMNLDAVAIATIQLRTVDISKADQLVRLCSIKLQHVMYVPEMLQHGATMTRMLSQRASHRAHASSNPVFIDAAQFSVIYMGNFYIPLDQ